MESRDKLPNNDGLEAAVLIWDEAAVLIWDEAAELIGDEVLPR